MTRVTPLEAFAINESYIRAKSHGGGCCGMTHLFGFPSYGPNRPTTERKEMNTAQNLDWCKAYPGEFYVIHPQCTFRERLAFVLYNITSSRPDGIVEVAITQNQKAIWNDCLTEFGFKEVTNNRNSNSGNIIHVYLLNTSQDIHKIIDPIIRLVPDQKIFPTKPVIEVKAEPQVEYA